MLHNDLPINHIAAAGKNILVRINAVVLQLLILSCIINVYEAIILYCKMIMI